jgi:hypothetical protein
MEVGRGDLDALLYVKCIVECYGQIRGGSPLDKVGIQALRSGIACVYPDIGCVGLLARYAWACGIMGYYDGGRIAILLSIRQSLIPIQPGGNLQHTSDYFSFGVLYP